MTREEIEGAVRNTFTHGRDSLICVVRLDYIADFAIAQVNAALEEAAFTIDEADYCLVYECHCRKIADDIQKAIRALKIKE